MARTVAKVTSFSFLCINLVGWLVILVGFFLLATNNPVNSVVAFIIGGVLLCLSKLAVLVLDHKNKDKSGYKEFSKVAKEKMR